MTYEADLARFAEHLASMLSAPPRPDPADLPIVDAARLAVRRWCRQVLAVVAPTSETLDRRRQFGVAVDPVGAQRRLLERDPQPLGEAAPTNVGFDQPAVDEAGRTWKTLRVRAVIAEHGWSLATPESMPSGDAAWSVIADVATVAEAAALLDRDLARNLPTRAGRPSRTGIDRDGWEIAAVAEQVRRLAARGSLPSAAPLRARRVLPLRVQTLGDVAPGLARLNELLTIAPHLRPEAISVVAGAHWRTVLTLADIVESHQSQPAVEMANELRVHAAILRRLQRTTRDVASIDSDDPRPIRQANQIRLALRPLERSDRAGATPHRALTAALRPALRMAPSLRDVVERHLRAGAWHQRAQAGRHGWVPTSDSADLPLRGVALRAAEQAERLVSQLPTPTAQATANYSPRAVLSAQLLSGDSKQPDLLLNP